MQSFFKKLLFDLYKFQVERKSYTAIKGFSIIRKTNPDFVNQLRNRIADKKKNIHPTFFEKIIFTRKIDISLSVHQYLLKLFLGRMFTRTILSCIYTKKKFIYPLPKHWLKIVDESGITVSYFFSSIAFYFFVIIFYFYAVFSLGSIIFNKKQKFNLSLAGMELIIL